MHDMMKVNKHDMMKVNKHDNITNQSNMCAHS